MEQNEFSRQIEKHNAILAKYCAVSDIIGYIRLLLFPLIGVTLLFAFIRGFPKAWIIAGLIECAALDILWLYHNMARGRVRHSDKIIALNKDHLNRISGISAALSDIETGYANNSNPHSFDSAFSGGDIFSQFTNPPDTRNAIREAAKDPVRIRVSGAESANRDAALPGWYNDRDSSGNMYPSLIKKQESNSPQMLFDGLIEHGMFANNKAIRFLTM